MWAALVTPLVVLLAFNAIVVTMGPLPDSTAYSDDFDFAQRRGAEAAAWLGALLSAASESVSSWLTAFFDVVPPALAAGIVAAMVSAWFAGRGERKRERNERRRGRESVYANFIAAVAKDPSSAESADAAARYRLEMRGPVFAAYADELVLAVSGDAPSNEAAWFPIELRRLDAMDDRRVVRFVLYEFFFCLRKFRAALRADWEERMRDSLRGSLRTGTSPAVLMWVSKAKDRIWFWGRLIGALFVAIQPNRRHRRA